MSDRPGPNWDRIARLFHAALEQPREQRAAWLAQSCAGDDLLRREVEQLLGVHERGAVHDRGPAHAVYEGLTTLYAGAVTPPAEETVEMTGRQVGRYRLIRMLGRGGMGVVFQAHDPQLDRFVALKFLPPSESGSRQARLRLLAEARAASALDHPNICAIYDIGETEDGHVFIAMACYEGRTLDRRIAAGPVPPEEAVEIAAQIAAGLRCAHEAGVVHRDIKPSNIMVTPRGEVKILDFGAAQWRTAASQALPGMRIGTLAYMAPEQVRGQEVDGRADLWALGAVLFEMLSGHRPFRGDSESALLDSILNDDPPRLEGLPCCNQGEATAPASRGPARVELAPATLDAIIARSLARNPQDRYQSATEFLAAIAALGCSVTAGAIACVQAPPALEPAPLPVVLTSFVGRKKEIEEVAALLAGTRLVTLTGPAGAGKTRLSLEAARRIGPSLKHGIAFVPLASITDPSLVPPAIANSVGIAPAPETPVAERLRDALSGREMLLVLDNFEQVTAAAPAIAELLAACPRLRLLCSSRIPLRISGEHEYPVPPLELPAPGEPPKPAALERYSAIALFTERARAVRPAFSVTETNAAAVAELCTRLDALPLAIELAAARSRLFSPEALLARLGDRLNLLTGGPRDLPPRQQTLRQAIAWSYDLLDPAHQALFRRLGVFTGGCSLEAAATLCRAEPALPLDPLDGVASLVEQSLLRQEEGRDGEPRVRMLETIRAYALECLDQSGEGEAARRTQAVWFLDLAERAEPELIAASAPAWLDRLETERGNLRAALEWAESRGEADLGIRLGSALLRFWLARGSIREGRQVLEHLLAMHSFRASRDGVASMAQASASPSDSVAHLPREVSSSASSGGTRARGLNALATLAQYQGDNAEARAWLEEALALARPLGDKAAVASILNNMAWVACELSDFDATRSLSEEALDINQQLGEKRGVALALNNLGWVANYQGDYRAGRSLHARSLALRREIGDQRGIIFALCNLAWAEQIHGNYQQAGHHLEEAQQIVRVVNDKVFSVLVLVMRATGAFEREQYDLAASLLEQSRRAVREAGNKSLRAWVHWLLGAVRLQQEDLEKAARLLQDSLEIWKAVGGWWGGAAVRCSLGRLAFAQGDLDRAVESYRKSLEVRERLGDRRGMAECLEALAEVAMTRAASDTHAGAGSPQSSPPAGLSAGTEYAGAAELLGAAAALREEVEAPVPPWRRAAYDACLAAVEAALGAAAREEALARGRARGASVSSLLPPLAGQLMNED